MLKNKKLNIAVLLGLLYFIISLFTLPDYGINWDTINHLPRGQAYLNYFLTGKKDYSNLPMFQTYWQDPETLLIKSDKPKSEIVRRSLYQNNGFTFQDLMGWDGRGHPPLSDIISSLFNKILFGKLGLINDIDSYRVYGILLASFLIGLVFYWTSIYFGSLAGFVSALSLATYPLFWAESHFNTEKDIPEAVYWSFFLFVFSNGIIKKNSKTILLSGIFFGLALGTKFNILFSFAVLIPWVLVYWFSCKPKIKEYKKTIAFSFFAVLLGFLIFIATWPFLWQDLVWGLGQVLGFYKAIGVTGGSGSISNLMTPNFYPIRWIFLTTPVVTLFLCLMSLLALPKIIKGDKTKIGLLFLLWLLVPILRVSSKETVIYGGVRQIMEFIPAMAILSGIGFKFLYDKFQNKFKYAPSLAYIMTVVIFLPIIFKLIQIHPNENAFFNFLVGGLKGAKKLNIASWGNTFGAAYRKGIVWINKNAEPNSKLTFAFELMPNVPNNWVRKDILFHNTRRSGFIRDGEYAITLTYQGTAERSYYDRYLELTQKPVFQELVDGVAVLKIWKNTKENSADNYRELSSVDNVVAVYKKGNMELLLNKSFKLVYLDVVFSNNECSKLVSGIVSLSSDGKNWNNYPDPLPTGQISIFGEQPSESRLVYSFLGEEAQKIRIEFKPSDACLKNVDDVKIYILKES